MGNEKKESEQKDTLIDFLYKDTKLIESFYAQLFGGNLTMVKKAYAEGNESNKMANVGILAAKGELTYKKNDNKEITTNINPHDYKIITLLEELNLNKSISLDVPTGTIVAIEGNLIFRNYDTINKLLPFMTNNNLVPEFNNPVYSNSKGKAKSLTIGKMLTQIFQLLPYSLEFELCTNDNKSAICILKEEALTISPDDILRSYGTNIPSSWTIVGIIDFPPKLKNKSSNNFKDTIDQATNAFSEFIIDTNAPTIKPIAIYRKIVL